MASWCSASATSKACDERAGETPSLRSAEAVDMTAKRAPKPRPVAGRWRSLQHNSARSALRDASKRKERHPGRVPVNQCASIARSTLAKPSEAVPADLTNRAGRRRSGGRFFYASRIEICDQYGADSKSRNSALLASYAAATRLPSEPSMTVFPSVVETHHLHFRPRLFTTTSKTGNRQSIAEVSSGTEIPIFATKAPTNSTFSRRSALRTLQRSNLKPKAFQN